MTHPWMMILALAFAFGAFTYLMWPKLRLLRVARHRPELVSDIPSRIRNMLTIAFGQKKMFLLKREIGPGLMHAFIFWGFLVIQVRFIYLVALAFQPAFPGDLPAGTPGSSGLGALVDPLWQIPFVHHPYALLKDLTEIVVLAMVGYAWWRRVKVRPKRLTLSPEGLLILLMIMMVVVTDFGLDGFRFAYAEAASGGTLPAQLSAEASFAPVGMLLGKVLVGLSPSTLQIGIEASYWGHVFIVLTFLNLLPGSKHFHVITSIPQAFFGEVKPKGALTPIDRIEEQETFGVGDVGDFTWRQYLDLYSCTECGRCEVNCPTTLTGKPLNPKLLIDNIRDHLYQREPELLGSGESRTQQSLVDAVGYDAIWDCTTCRACSEACPISIEHVDKIVDMRRHLVLMESNLPKELGATLKNLENKGNPWGLPRADRVKWAQGLELPTLEENPDAEYVFWVGCAGSYDERQKKVSRAVVQIMRAAGVSFATLGLDEGCTGDPARRAGNEYLFQIMAKANITMLTEKGVQKKKLVTHCPHCFNTLKNEYPQFGGVFEVLHHTKLIDDLRKQGKLELKRTPEGTQLVTYHDSCYIGRYNGVFEEPREAIQALPGVELREMERQRKSGMCCGAGGARMWMEEHRGTRINQERVRQAMETKADTIAVACPFCNTMLEDGLKELGIEGVKTRDVAELVAASLEPRATSRTP
jgi:Fe-S oxidoreductase